MSTRPEATRAALCRLALLLAVALALGLAVADQAHAQRARLIRVCHRATDGQELHLLARGAKGCPRRDRLVWPAGAAGRRRVTSLRASLGITANIDLNSQPAPAPAPAAKTSRSFWHWLAGARPVFQNAFLIAGFGLLALIVVAFLVTTIWRWLLAGWLRNRGRVNCRPAVPGGACSPPRVTVFLRWLVGPTLQVQPFDDSALSSHIGAAIAAVVATRLTGGRDDGLHIYTIGGEQDPSAALGALQAGTQTQPIAAALALMALIRRRPRLTARGALLPAAVPPAGARVAPVGRTAGDEVALALSLSLESQMVDAADFWPSEPPTAGVSQRAAERVLAVAAAGWIQHRAVDYTPGPCAGEIFGSPDARSWALFRAGSELQRLSLLGNAADAYEQALAIDPRNVGALVDLAHLRRREKFFEGAAKLTEQAVRWIEERDRASGLPLPFDADWYRAQNVLATTWAVWANDLQASAAARAGQLRADALELAVSVARCAIRARLAIIGTVTDPTGPVSSGKLDDLWAAMCDVAAGESMPVEGNRPCGATRERQARGALAIVETLERALEPGALLLVAGASSSIEAPVKSSAERQAEFERAVAIAENDGSRSRDEAREQVRSKLRNAVLDELGPPERRRELNPEPLMDYVESTDQKAPRVDYNLACYYSRNAAAIVLPARLTDARHRETLLESAYEYFRRSIHRTAVLERSGLLEYAERDPDLSAMRAAHPRAISELARISPAA